MPVQVQSQNVASPPQTSPEIQPRDATHAPKLKAGPRNPWPEPAAEPKVKFKKPVSARNFKRQMIASQEALRRFALKLCKREDVAQDLMQEALMKAWAARHQFKPGSSFLSWSFTILRNTWINQLRREKKFVAEVDDQAAERMLTAPPSQITTFELADLQRAMSELPTDQLEAVMLVGPGDLTYEEAGAILGCAAGTVKSRASRARAILGDILDEGKVRMDMADTQDAANIAENFVEAIETIERGGNIENVINLEQTG